MCLEFKLNSFGILNLIIMKSVIMKQTKSMLNVIVDLKGNETKAIEAERLQDLHEYCYVTQPSILSDMHGMIKLMDFPCKEEALDVIGYYCAEYLMCKEDAFDAGYEY